MKIRPGRGMLAICVVMAGIAAFSQLWTGLLWLIPALLGAIVCFSVLDLIQLRGAWVHIHVRLVAPAYAERGDEFLLRIFIKYALNSYIRAEVRSVLPGEASPQMWRQNAVFRPESECEFSEHVRIDTRGLYTCGPIWLRLTGRFAMLEGQRCFDNQSQIKILPDCAISKESLHANRAEAQMMEKMTRNRLRGAGLEFESLSEYSAGDDPRRIDWRSSARHRQLVVRRFHLEHHRDVMVVVDCGRLMGASAGQGTKLDRAVDSALLLSHVALDKGDRCGLALFDNQVLGYLPPISGKGAYRAIMDRVYNVQSHWREPNFSTMFAALQTRQLKRALVVVLSDLVDAATSLSYRAALAKLGRRHLVIFAALRTPLVEEIARAQPNEDVDIFKSAVSLRLLREREKALHELSRSGVHIVDVEPRHLTVPLINSYIDLRERNLL